MIAQGASFGTLVISKSALGENELTVETETVRDIPQTKWATDSVKENYPQTYEEGATYQLNLTGNKGYVAIWKTCKESIVSVDKNGCITALKEGTATVIAQIGNSVVECQIVVKQSWTEGY